MQPKQKLTRDDWEFSQLFDDEVRACWCWEFCREKPEAIDQVTRARTKAKVTGFDALLNHRFSQFTGEGEPCPDLYAMHLFACSPEWPAAPYLSVKFPERKRRRVAWEAINPAITWQEMDFDFDDVHRLEPFYRPDQFAKERLAVFTIDWSLSPEEILTNFAAWLKDHRPADYPSPTKAHVGAGSPLVQWRADLKALAAWRLLRAHGDVRSAHIASGGAVYEDAAGPSWSRGKKRVKAILSLPLSDLSF